MSFFDLVNDENINGTDDGFEVKREEYSLQEATIFVHTMMSGKLDEKLLIQAMMGLGFALDISEEKYEVSTVDGEGQLESSITSDMMIYVDKTLDLLVIKEDYYQWVEYLKELLLKEENYEALHEFQLEKTWGIQ